MPTEGEQAFHGGTTVYNCVQARNDIQSSELTGGSGTATRRHMSLIRNVRYVIGIPTTYFQHELRFPPQIRHSYR